MEEWHDRLRRKMKELGWDKAELSRRSAINYDRINKYVRGNVKQPRGNVVEILAKTVGESVIWLRDGINIEQNGAKPHQKNPRSPVDSADQKQTIFELDIRAGIGGGGMPEEHTNSKGEILVPEDLILNEWVIPPSYMKGVLRVDARRAWIIEVDGDSGYDPSNPGAPGSLFPGDRVIIDTKDRRPSPPGPFLVNDGVGLVVKLVTVIANSDPVKVRLASRNPIYGPYEVTEDEARIIGRVRGRISAM